MTVFRCLQGNSGRSTSFHLFQVLLSVPAGAVCKKGLRVSYSEADNLTVKLEPTSFLRVKFQLARYHTLIGGVHCSMRPCFEARTAETNR